MVSQINFLALVVPLKPSPDIEEFDDGGNDGITEEDIGLVVDQSTRSESVLEYQSVDEEGDQGGVGELGNTR